MSKPFTTPSYECIFSKFSREKRQLLKSLIPTFRRIKVGEVYEKCEFKCFKQGVHVTRILISGDLYGFRKFNDRDEFIRTSIAKHSGENIVRNFSTLKIKELIAELVRIKLNRKENTIKYLSITSPNNILKYFQPVQVNIKCLYVNFVGRYESGSLRIFENLQRLEITIRNMPNEMMDDILHLDLEELELIVERFPDDRNLNFRAKKLEIEEEECGIQKFLSFLKKLSSGLHKDESYYKVLQITEIYDLSSFFTTHVAPNFSNAMIRMDKITISISESRELVVTQTVWGVKAIVSAKETDGF